MANADRLIEVFNEAKARPVGPERERFLAEACRADPALKEQVISLLQAHEGAGDFLKNTAPTIVQVTEKPGDKIGHYKLLQQVGEGGCGVVYMAEQSEPVRRRVALKVIKLGMDTKQVVARFEAERQALALMDHPNIAKVFDAGATDAGRPYFVMELVRGIKITDYCDQNNLSTTERLDLFIQVCQAIQHAHQKGIIHRDIKPSNILVAQHDTVAVPKVIDFGIAKATNDQRLTDKTLFTAFEQFMGTPAYMSPEQAQMSGLDIDTRTDIYSLGVLLYELLAGSTPFDAKELMASGIDAMRKTIREKEPIRPSTRLGTMLEGELTTAAKHRHTDAPKLVHLLRGDLDWMVMKCLEKDRSRRYETANGLAADLKRHLGNEPIVARAPSAAYRLQKAFRRNKLAFTAAAVVGVVLVLGVMVSTWQAFEARRARNAAQTERDKAQTAQKEAERAQQAEQQERQRAERGELEARQKAYASDMKLAQQEVAQNNLGLAQELLNRHRPTQTQLSTINSPLSTDLRGWEWRYLWRQCQGEERFILGAHTNGATAVGLLADGKTVFSAGQDKFVRLWDLESQRQIGLLPHPEAIVGAVASPDGRWLATATMKAGEGQPVLLWDLATQKIAAPLTAEFWVRPLSITFSPDSKWLAFGTFWGGVRIWDVEARSEVTNLPVIDKSSWLLGIAFSPDSRTLAYNENDYGAILLWDIASRSVIHRLTGHQSVVTALAFSPDGHALASGSDDQTARLWNLPDGQEKFQFTNQTGGFASMAFSPDSRTLAIPRNGQVIRLIDVATGSQKAELRGHFNEISSLAFTPDGQTLLSASDDGTVRIWDPVPRAKENSTHVFAHNSISVEWGGYGPALLLSPDGRYLLTVYTNQTFGLWDTLRLAEGERHPLPFTNTTIAAVAPGGKLAAFGSRRGEVMLWDVEAGQPAAPLRSAAQAGQGQVFAQPGTNRVHLLVFSLDGRYLAACDDAKTPSQMGVASNTPRVIRIWDVGARKQTDVSTEGEYPLSLTFSTDARALMAGFWKGPVKLWSLGGPGEAATFLGHSGQVHGLALLPDGQTLISAGPDIRFWDVRTRHENALKLTPRAGEYHCIALSPDGRRLAAGADDARIAIWDLASHQEVATLEGHNEAVMHLAFTPDGDHLVSVSKDQLRVWRASSWPEIETAENKARK